MTLLLDQITTPQDLHSFSLQQLSQLASECRERIIEITSQHGGHLASSLGAVELSIALCKTFDLTDDQIVWDIGHQAYSYKLLTGRNQLFAQLGKRGGIAKFLIRSESNYDQFGAGHASTSISAALGMATARDLQKKNHHVVAVIGDGAMTGGMAFEALNNAGHLKSNLTVVLNDNAMSIDQNVGGLSKTITNLQTSKMLNWVRNEFSKLDEQGKIPKLLSKILRRSETSFKAFFTPGVFFETLGLRYFGPIDGHNIKDLIEIFKQTKNLRGPILIHILTKKGKGYSYAEGSSPEYHGVNPFDPETGQILPISSLGKSFTEIFSQSFEKVLAHDQQVVAISAAMLGNTKLKTIAKKYPDRVFDVGIAEEHAVTFAAGLATQNLKPFVVIYSTFLQRAIDQIIHDVCLQNLPVRFILDRAGFVGSDGATHHGIFDLTFLRMIPNMVIMAPKNGKELQEMLYTAYHYNNGPIALRFPRDNTKHDKILSPEEVSSIPIGQGELIQEGQDILLLAIGNTVRTAKFVAQELTQKKFSVGIINARFIKPLDKKLILEQVIKVKLIATFEENTLQGGFGSAILELLSDNQSQIPLKRFGVIDEFIEYGTQQQQREQSQLDSKKITESLTNLYRQFNSNDKIK